MSLAAIGGGLMILGLYPRLRALWDGTPKPEAKAIFDATLGALATLARSITKACTTAALPAA